MQAVTERRSYSLGRRAILVALGLLFYASGPAGIADALAAGVFVVLVDGLIGTRTVAETARPYTRPFVAESGRWLQGLVLVTGASVIGMLVVVLAPRFIVGPNPELSRQSVVQAPRPIADYTSLLLLRPTLRPVCASWIGSDAPGDWQAVTGSCRELLLLGSANGGTVLYDAQLRVVLRAPSSKLFLVSA